jgi:hypothetical protein
MLTIVAMLGFAGFAFADTGTNQGIQVVPISKDLAAKKSLSFQLLGDGPENSGTGTTPGNHAGGTPLAPPSNDDCSGAIPISAASLPVVTTPVDVTDATPVSDGAGGGGENFCTSFEHTIWYTFTPTSSGQYTFATCPSKAPGNNVVDTVIGRLPDPA